MKEIEILKNQINHITTCYEESLDRIGANEEKINELDELISKIEEKEKENEKENIEQKNKIKNLSSNNNNKIELELKKLWEKIENLDKFVKEKISELEKGMSPFQVLLSDEDIEEILQKPGAKGSTGLRLIDQIIERINNLKEAKEEKGIVTDMYQKLSKELNDNYIRVEALFTKAGLDKSEQKKIEDLIFRKNMEKHFKNSEEEFTKVWKEILHLKDSQGPIFEVLTEKAKLSDVNIMKEAILTKIDDLKFLFDDKYPDKKETINKLRSLEDQIKKTSEIASQKEENEGNNWLLAKKPITGYTCASCESYIGDLKKDQFKYLPWNKLPIHDSGESLYRMGNGFSRILQMVNPPDSNNNGFSNNLSLVSPNSTVDANFYKSGEHPSRIIMMRTTQESSMQQIGTKTGEFNFKKTRIKSAHSKDEKNNNSKSKSKSKEKDRKNSNNNGGINININNNNCNNIIIEQEKNNYDGKKLPKLKGSTSSEDFHPISFGKNGLPNPTITKILRKSQGKFS